MSLARHRTNEGHRVDLSELQEHLPEPGTYPRPIYRHDVSTFEGHGGLVSVDLSDKNGSG